MHRFRIGNDISLKWAVFYGGVPYDLTGKPISIKVSTIYGEEPIEGYTVVGNIVSWTFRGAEQKRLGVYTLTLTAEEVSGRRVVIDECKAFELVARGCESGCEGGEVELASNLGFDAYDPHAVHYDEPQALTTADKVQVSENIGTRPLYILDLTDAVTEQFGTDCTEFSVAITDELMLRYYGITVEEFAEIAKTHDVRFQLGRVVLTEDGELDWERSWSDEMVTDTAIRSSCWVIPMLTASYTSLMIDQPRGGIQMMVLTKELAEGMGMGDEAMIMIEGGDYYHTLELNINGQSDTYDPVYSGFSRSFYAPTVRGNKGQLLVGGDSATPQWLPSGEIGAVLVAGGDSATPQWVMPEKSLTWELTNEWQTPEEDVLTCTAYDSTTGYFEVATMPDWVTTAGEWCCIGYTEAVLRGELAINKAPLGSTKCNLVLVKKIDDTHIELVSSLTSTERTRLTEIGATEYLTIPSGVDVATFTLTRAKSVSFLNQSRFCTSVQFNQDKANDPKSGVTRYKIVIEGAPLRTSPSDSVGGNALLGTNHKAVVWPTKMPNNSQATYKNGYLRFLYAPDAELRPFGVKMELVITVDFDTTDYDEVFIIEEIHCEGFLRGANNAVTPFIDPVISGMLGRGVGDSTYHLLLNLMAVTADTKVKIYKERTE